MGYTFCWLFFFLNFLQDFEIFSQYKLGKSQTNKGATHIPPWVSATAPAQVLPSYLGANCGLKLFKFHQLWLHSCSGSTGVMDSSEQGRQSWLDRPLQYTLISCRHAGAQQKLATQMWAKGRFPYDLVRGKKNFTFQVELLGWLAGWKLS